MATEILVENLIDDGKILVDQLVLDGFDVAAASWLKTSEEGLWHLYIASPLVDPLKPGKAYRVVFTSLNKVAPSAVQISDLKLINNSNPIAHEILNIRDRSPLNVPTRLRGKRIGRLDIEESYLYPATRADTNEALGGLVRFLREHRQEGFGIDPNDYKTSDGKPFPDEKSLIDYWTDLLSRMPQERPVG